MNNEILQRYGTLLAEVDAWFARCMAAFPTEIVCKSGCTGCCRGLFDITLLDARYLREGFDRHDPGLKQTMLRKAEERLESLRNIWPELEQPYLLNHRPEEEWETLMPDADETPCLLLDDDGRCLVYDHRPMTCRLHGLPLVDFSGEVFMDEWCTDNFRDIDPMQLEEIRWKFFTHFSEELDQFREFTEKLLGKPVNELDTLIPLALLIDFDGYDWGS
ncbi:MAG: YkgJ family cysteine cluster protein [Geobacter sp.]|nr:YkgJ family cysteine cluster protein [Geobacter sp.]